MSETFSESSRFWLSRAAGFGSGLGALLLAVVLAAPAAHSAGAVDPAIEKTLRQRLGSPAVGLEVKAIEHSEIPGVYRVEIDEGPVVYATADGNFFIVGDMYSVGIAGITNLAEQRRSQNRRQALAAVPEGEQIVFPAKGEAKSYITVFTDVSCFYCQKLHQEVPELNRRGVEVRYLAYPRQGIGSPGFRQLASAWCADDRQATLTAFKNRESLKEDVCPGNPVAEQFALGQALGVRGTPAIVMPSGEMIPGYKSADDLMEVLGLN